MGKVRESAYFCLMTKRKLQRFAENETFTNVFQPTSKYPFKDFKLKGKWNEEYFKNDNPIVLELGCGRGEYATQLSEKYPGKNFIGIDIKGARLWRGAKTATENNMPNVCFVRTQIQLLRYFFGANEVSEIWLTFPDPQPQSSRIRKRLTYPHFLEMYRDILIPDGIIHLKTDNKPLYEYSMQTAAANNFIFSSGTDNLYSSKLMDVVPNIQTKYETIFLKQGASICYLKLISKK
jgi:tRNA (guanine-N7-)-methyltransferase